MDHAEYMREWRRKNPERERAIKQRYYQTRGREVQSARLKAIRQGARRLRPYVPMGRPASERFWEKVIKSDGCWEMRSPARYPSFWLGRRNIAASRASWILNRGPIPDDMEVCHHCDNPPCVRPDHLFLGTHADNMADMAAKGRAAHHGLPGERHPLARLTEQAVKEIRDLNSRGVSKAALARRFHVSKGNVRFVVQRKTWRHVA